MPNDFNLKYGQRAERKLLITVAEWYDEESGQNIREILGTRTEDSSIEYNADIQTSTDIRGINYTDVDKTQPQQDFDPFLVLGGSKLGAKLNDIRRRNAVSELSQFTMYIITAYIGNKQDGYEAEKQVNCTIAYNSLGGDTNVNFPISVYFSNDTVVGTVDKLSDDFEFTPDGKIRVDTTTLSIPSQSATWLDMPISALIGDNVRVLADGSVLGDLNHVESFPEYSSDKEEQSGNFFPLRLSQTTGTFMTLKRNGVTVKDKENIQFDRDIIFRVENNAQTNTIIVDGQTVITLNFKQADLLSSN